MNNVLTIAGSAFPLAILSLALGASAPALAQSTAGGAQDAGEASAAEAAPLAAKEASSMRKR